MQQLFLKIAPLWGKWINEYFLSLKHWKSLKISTWYHIVTRSQSLFWFVPQAGSASSTLKKTLPRLLTVQILPIVASLRQLYLKDIAAIKSRSPCLQPVLVCLPKLYTFVWTDSTLNFSSKTWFSRLIRIFQGSHNTNLSLIWTSNKI